MCRPLCFLVRRNPTVGLAGILERSYSLSKKNITIFRHCKSPSRFAFHFFHFPSFLSTNSIHFLLSFLSFPPFFFFPFCFPFLFLFLISFCFSFLLFLFLFALSLPFWSIDRMGQNEEISSPPSSSQMCGFPFSFFFFYFLILFYDITPYMA